MYRSGAQVFQFFFYRSEPPYTDNLKVDESSDSTPLVNSDPLVPTSLGTTVMAWGRTYCLTQGQRFFFFRLILLTVFYESYKWKIFLYFSNVDQPLYPLSKFLPHCKFLYVFSSQSKLKDIHIKGRGKVQKSPYSVRERKTPLYRCVR